jgi:hypothetical protein
LVATVGKVLDEGQFKVLPSCIEKFWELCIWRVEGYAKKLLNT